MLNYSVAELRVTIKISPTKGDKIGTYNLWWENVGFGFSFD
jgi:hypothetical protein